MILGVNSYPVEEGQNSKVHVEFTHVQWKFISFSDQEQQKFEFFDCNSNITRNSSPLCDKTVGIIGYGRVGQAVAQRFEELGVKHFLYTDLHEVDNPRPTAKSVNFAQLVSEADIICICCKAMQNTKHLFQKDAFKKMKKVAILVDSYSKGNAINYCDLYNALRENRISAAGLDVRDVNQTHPFKTNLSGLHNCYFFPFKECNHVWDMRSAASASVARNVVAALRLGRHSEQEERWSRLIALSPFITLHEHFHFLSWHIANVYC